MTNTITTKTIAGDDTNYDEDNYSVSSPILIIHIWEQNDRINII